MSLKPVTIIGVGKCLPDRIITNDELSQIVETNDEWISSRTGFKQRRVISGSESVSSLAIGAAKDALEFAGMTGEDVDLIVCASSTPDYMFPSTACEVQAAIGSKAPAFNVIAACSGLVYGISIANSFISAGTYKRVLVIGAEAHSRYIDWQDRNTCVLFGDGAGAILMSESDGENDVLSVELAADGKKALELTLPSGKTSCPLVELEQKDESDYIWMNGKEIYKFAVVTVPKTIKSAIEKAGLEIEDLTYLVPHHANMRIISAVQDRLKLKDEQIIVSLENYANTSTASTPIALSEAMEAGKLKRGDVIALCGFGGGLTWGTAIIRWNAEDKRKTDGLESLKK
ncbi:MAG: ketoacyl-ACP synthase III [Candidatus Gastranaerophilales bacterium]|nr:ketoacyl-ACP synthase III [Candidatus Gastranaerophilales bacterium]